jgi:hypothetical protein
MRSSSGGAEPAVPVRFTDPAWQHLRHLLIRPHPNAPPPWPTDRTATMMRLFDRRQDAGQPPRWTLTALAMVAASSGKPNKLPDRRRISQRRPRNQRPGATAAASSCRSCPSASTRVGRARSSRRPTRCTTPRWRYPRRAGPATSAGPIERGVMVVGLGGWRVQAAAADALVGPGPDPGGHGVPVARLAATWGRRRPARRPPRPAARPAWRRPRPGPAGAGPGPGPRSPWR